MSDRPLSPATTDALRVLGLQIATARRARRWTSAELAERAGVSLLTLRRAERGEPSVSIGTVFELATLVGVPLYFPEREAVSLAGATLADRLALLPSRVRERSGDDRDDF